MTVLELVVGDEPIYKFKNGKEPDPRGKNKSLSEVGTHAQLEKVERKRAFHW